MSAEGTFDFGVALSLLKDGHRVARQGWNGKGMWLALVRPCSENDPPRYKPGYIAVGEEIEGLTRLPWIGMRTADNGFVPWLASQTDVLAEDWVDLEVIDVPADINRDPLPYWDNAPPPEEAPPPAPPLDVGAIINAAVTRLLALAETGDMGKMPEKPVDLLVKVCRQHLEGKGAQIPADLRDRCNDALLAALMGGR